jgi:hypothetical protein
VKWKWVGARKERIEEQAGQEVARNNGLVGGSCGLMGSLSSSRRRRRRRRRRRKRELILGYPNIA